MRIRVSGAVVSLASEVLAKMLSSPFLEGQTKEIKLPEDDPGTVLDFCYIVHHKVTDPPQCNGSRLKELAILADMWMSKDAIRPWIIARLIDATVELGDGVTSFVSSCATLGRREAFFIPSRYSLGDVDFVSMCGPAEVGSLQLDVEVVVDIAAILGLENLFWRATRAWIATTPNGSSIRPTSGARPRPGRRERVRTTVSSTLDRLSHGSSNVICVTEPKETKFRGNDTRGTRDTVHSN